MEFFFITFLITGAADLCKDPGRCGPSDQSARCLFVLCPAPFLLHLLLSAEHLQDNDSSIKNCLHNDDVWLISFSRAEVGLPTRTIIQVPVTDYFKNNLFIFIYRFIWYHFKELINADWFPLIKWLNLQKVNTSLVWWSNSWRSFKLSHNQRGTLEGKINNCHF